MMELSSSLEISDRVFFLGARNDIPALMSASDVFVLSSAWEGFGLVVAEAMACKRIVVATGCGGVKEVVGDAGYLVPPGDCDALARSMLQALELSCEKRGEIGENARQRVISKFSLDAAAGRYMALYAGATSNGGFF
jgi:glycosyltransferase involved in cell wall biosynthesis